MNNFIKLNCPFQFDLFCNHINSMYKMFACDNTIHSLINCIEIIITNVNFKFKQIEIINEYRI